MVEKHLSTFKDSRSVCSPANQNTSPSSFDLDFCSENSDTESESAIEDLLSARLYYGRNPSMSMLNIHVLNAFLIMAMFENFIQYSIYRYAFGLLLA